MYTRLKILKHRLQKSLKILFLFALYSYKSYKSYELLLKQNISVENMTRAYLDNDVGVTVKKRDKKLIVSLTSYGYRVDTVFLTIQSIFSQSIKPDKVLLYLAKDEFTEQNIPENLKRFISRGLEIIFCKDIKSYKKLIYALKEYPNDLIVTADDDIIYPKFWLEQLYKAYLEDPNYIHCHRVHYMTKDIRGRLNKYKKWVVESDRLEASFLVFPTGGAGAIYSLALLNENVTNENLFMELAPTADDVWLKAMSLLNSTKCKKVNSNIMKKLHIVEGTQENALYYINYHQNQNDIQIKKVFDHFNLWNRLV